MTPGGETRFRQTFGTFPEDSEIMQFSNPPDNRTFKTAFPTPLRSEARKETGESGLISFAPK